MRRTSTTFFCPEIDRNTGILVPMGNIMVYGMTDGQVVSTTPFKTTTATTPYESFEHPLDATKPAIAARAAIRCTLDNGTSEKIKRID